MGFIDNCECGGERPDRTGFAALCIIQWLVAEHDARNEMRSLLLSQKINCEAMEVHAEVLEMAKTEEKRELIKWYHARRVFFPDSVLYGRDPKYEERLALLRLCKHDDARFLLSLFPVVPMSDQQAASVFLAQGDDARCLCWSVVCGGLPVEIGRTLLLSSEKGCAWGLSKYAQMCLYGPERLEAMEKAAAQGEPDAMAQLGYDLWYGKSGANKDESRAECLWREGALLGCPVAQLHLATRFCVPNSLERVTWLRRSAVQNLSTAIGALAREVREACRRFADGGSGRVLFEYGLTFATIDLRNQMDRFAYDTVVKCFEQWCSDAKRSILCWLWAAKQLGVAKDMRVMIADLIWKEKAAWSERNGESVT